MDTRTRRIAVRKMLLAFLWSIVFFLLTSICCLIYFSATAYDFADFAMIESVLDESGQPKANQAAYNNPGAKFAYAVITMYESDIFLGLLLFSIAASIFGAYVGILPGTDEESIKEMLRRAEDETVTAFTLSPHCPNCGTYVEQGWEYCPQCGQARSASRELTLTNFARSAIPEILNIDRKFFRSLWYLLTRPGFLTQEYLRFRHQTYTLPTQLYFVVAAVFFFVSLKLDISTDVLLKQPQFAKAIQEKAEEAKLPVEVIQERLDNVVQNYIPLYTLLIVLLFALALKVIYPNWYYIEHLIFSLHFITYFLVLWMGLIVVSVKFAWLGTFGPLLPLPYLYYALKNVHAGRVGWRYIPAALAFLLLFIIYEFLSLALGFYLI
ncbi:MAG: DUF3667 domain-containing protein [Bacteroidota bacterium]|nr:DUF3667 domain-containing protein [Candidatus Kapabacteria bacterium]MDW8219159.1 DUF3667 domain-containing protein [Bacteroidota bacterium]